MIRVVWEYPGALFIGPWCLQLRWLDWTFGWGVPSGDPDYPLWHLWIGPLHINRLRA